MEFLVQCFYLYILTTDGLCSTSLAYPKKLCVSHEINIYYVYYMISLFLDLLSYSL